MRAGSFYHKSVSSLIRDNHTRSSLIIGRKEGIGNNVPLFFTVETRCTKLYFFGYNNSFINLQLLSFESERRPLCETEIFLV